MRTRRGTGEASLGDGGSTARTVQGASATARVNGWSKKTQIREVMRDSAAQEADRTEMGGR